jgi:cytochrome c-type biogenesis protein CcmH
MLITRTKMVLAFASIGIIGAIAVYSLSHKSPKSPRSSTELKSDIRDFLQQNSTAPVLSSVDAMIEKLAARLEQEPDDVEGWRMLGWSYFSQERHQEAAQAYAHTVRLAPNNAKYQSAYGEALVMAAGGFVSDEALAVFDTTLALNPSDPRARFFKGLSLDQAGKSDDAITAWITMVNTAPESSDWVPDLRDRITTRAAELGMDIDGRLTPLPPQNQAEQRNPTQAQIKASMQLSATDRQKMIEDMVANLAMRLNENPQDPEGWIKLIRSRMVLGRPMDAQNDLRTALNTFSQSANIREHIISEAKLLGVSLP